MSLGVWWLDGYAGNYGDILTPYILDHYNIKHHWVSSLSKPFDAICIGSIIRRAQKDTLVLGSGVISKNDRINPNANFKFVRGPLTRDKVILQGGQCPDIYGDAALLLPEIVRPSTKKYKIGIAPHIIDFAYTKQNYPDYHVINLKTKKPLEVAKQITECEYIISSSLHGCITAIAYGIPCAWVKIKNKLKGDDIKFYDFFESAGIQNAERSTIENPKFFDAEYNITPIKEQFEILANEKRY